MRPPTLLLGLDGAELVEGSLRVQLRHLRGTGPFLTDVGVAAETVEWIVRPAGGAGRVQVTARSDKGGLARSAWVELH